MKGGGRWPGLLLQQRRVVRCASYAGCCLPMRESRCEGPRAHVFVLQCSGLAWVVQHAPEDSGHDGCRRTGRSEDAAAQLPCASDIVRHNTRRATAVVTPYVMTRGCCRAGRGADGKASIQNMEGDRRCRLVHPRQSRCRTTGMRGATKATACACEAAVRASSGGE